MKIALITYYRSTNIGAVMQTYALCRYLKQSGHAVTIIDVRQDERANQLFYVKIIKSIVWSYRMKSLLAKYYPPLTRHYRTLKDLQNDPPKSDCYLVGSDQVWNPYISKDLMYAFFLDFGEINVKRVSYASSFGLSSWPEDYIHSVSYITCLLRRFDSLSVREEQGKSLCERTFGLSPKVVLDPTFLNETYDEFCRNVIERDFILCYKLNKTLDFWENIQYVGKTMNMKIMLLNYNYPKKGFLYCFPPSVKKWMRKFAEAKFIVTDSFHGIAFSIINRKQFVVILNDDGKNSRLINLLLKMGLENRMFNSISEMKTNNSWLQTIDYSKVEPKLYDNVLYSRKYLIESISK